MIVVLGSKDHRNYTKNQNYKKLMIKIGLNSLSEEI